MTKTATEQEMKFYALTDELGELGKETFINWLGRQTDLAKTAEAILNAVGSHPTSFVFKVIRYPGMD